MNLKNHPLFQDLSESDLDQLYHAACMRSQFFEKNQTVFHAGDRICEVGIVQTGNVQIEMIDLWGNKSILSSIAPGQIFAETYAICRKPLLVDVTAAAPCEILFLNLEFLARSFSEPGSCRDAIMQNLFAICVRKNLILSNRIFCTTPKTVRGRLLVYLSSESAKAGSTSFTIPFDRQGMADYLNLDRSALSKELGRMKKDGILDFKKNHFILYQNPL
ncbi:MAG: Crp/Fnr family transcriptional regulator [Lachnospiraceae bacterium]